MCGAMYARGYGHEGFMWPWVRLWYTGGLCLGPVLVHGLAWDALDVPLVLRL